MALLRACGILCRVHGFTIDKKLQKGAMTGFVYRNVPQNVFHSWVEVYFEGTSSGTVADKKIGLPTLWQTYDEQKCK